MSELTPEDEHDDAEPTICIFSLLLLVCYKINKLTYIMLYFSNIEAIQEHARVST